MTAKLRWNAQGRWRFGATLCRVRDGYRRATRGLLQWHDDARIHVRSGGFYDPPAPGNDVTAWGVPRPVNPLRPR